MQSGIPNNVDVDAESARNLIKGSNANGNTVNQGSPLTPTNTDSTAEQSARQEGEHPQTTPAPNATPNGGFQQKQDENSIADTHTPTQSDIVLAGKYRKEVPELNRKIKMHESTIEILQSKNANLEKEMQSLQQRLATPAKPDSGSVPSDPKSLMDALNPDDFEVYGDDFVKFAKIMKDSFAQIQAQAPAQKQPQPPQGRTPEQKAYDNILFSAIGENTFHDINRDPRFVNDFLNQVNPETSRYYRSDLLESHEDLDAATVIKIFRAFIDSLGGFYKPYSQQNQIPNNGMQNPARPPGNINNVSPTPNLAASNDRFTPNAMDTSQETFTQKQVDDFYKSITPGVGEFAGPQHAEWAHNMKSRILAAYNSGRVFKNIQ